MSNRITKDELLPSAPILANPCYVQPFLSLHNEDCLETMGRIETGSINLILTDPPYNTTACEWEYEIDLPKIWIEWERILKDDGVIVCFCDEPFTSRLIMSRLGFFKYRITWDKQIGSNFLNALKMPLKQTEDAVVFAKVKNGNYTYNPQMFDKPKQNVRPIGNRKPIEKTTYGKHAGNYSENYDNTKSHPSNLISFCGKEKECNSVNREHPTQKPLDLMRYLIRTYSNENDLVFDGYSGSGTTAHACIKEGRKFIGSELNKEYYEKSVKRIHNAICQPELFAGSGL
jgi:site-specific DNA-methyltransferase (adenine-specific)